MSPKIINQYLAVKDSGQSQNAPKVKLTEAIIKSLPIKPYDYQIGESTVPSLFVRVRTSGSKSFYIVRKVDGRMSRAKVCTYGERPYTQGKESVLVKARAMIAKMDAGVTPTKEKAVRRVKAAQEASLATTVKDACTNYINGKARALNTTKGYERFRDNHLTNWHSRQLSSVTEDDIADLFDDISERVGPVAANNVVRFFRAVWKFHRRKLNLGDCPTIIFTAEGDSVKQWNTEDRVKRYVAEQELTPWWDATERLRRDYGGDGDLAADYLQFVLLTGLRRREVSNLKWEDINTRRKSFVITDNKSNREHIVSITPALEDILQRRRGESRPFNIVDPKKFITQVAKWSGVPFSTHDLRRTFLSHATTVGVPMPVLKELVNHSRKIDVTDGYIQIADRVKRESLVMIQNYLLKQAGQTKNIVSLKVVFNG